MVVHGEAVIKSSRLNMGVNMGVMVIRESSCCVF